MVHISYLQKPYYQNQSYNTETMKGSAPKEKEPVPRFYGQPEIKSQFLNLLLFHTVTPHCTILTNT